MKRHEAREQAFFLIFERTFQEASLEELVESAQLARDITICGFAQNVFHGVEKHGEEIDGMIEKHCIGWTKNRLSRVAVSVLRTAVYEMLYEEKIPVSVSINEAVEIAKTYGSTE
ncbi:MAG: transcription antitermination factor NusB, partial [[Clostridium] leptum]